MMSVWILNFSSRFKRLNQDQIKTLDDRFGEEIRQDMWACDSDKVSGLDDLLFHFLKNYWDLMKTDVIACVKQFLINHRFRVDVTHILITLTPKVVNPMGIKYYHPISLIRMQYKIVVKLLTNIIAWVIDSLVSVEQFAFIKGRQISYGPMLVNELVTWYRTNKKKNHGFQSRF